MHFFLLSTLSALLLILPGWSEGESNKEDSKETKAIEKPENESHFEHLKELEWLLGDFEDQDKDEDTTISTHTEWDQYKNFLTQKFSVTEEGELTLEGRQIIGWDPVIEKIRSWVFDSAGGFGEGIWSKKGANYVVEFSQTLPDGGSASATNIYTPVDKDSYKWESTSREIDGEILPNIESVLIVRKRG